MINALAAAILALLTIGPGRYAAHVERQALPARSWAQQRAEWVDRAATVSGVPRAVLVALIHHESTFDEFARSPLGAEGLMQLMPGLPAHNYWLSVCAKEPAFCGYAHVEAGAIHLAQLRKRCGTMARALAAYRLGHCAEPGPRTWATIRLAQRVSYRLHIVSSAPLRAGGLP
jgi:hypothetical protein